MFLEDYNYQCTLLKIGKEYFEVVLRKGIVVICTEIELTYCTDRERLRVAWKRDLVSKVFGSNSKNKDKQP